MPKVLISDLKPSEYNPRAMTDHEREMVKASLLEEGQVVPIVVNSNEKRKNIIIGGHQRYEVAKELGWTELDVVYVDRDLRAEKKLNLRLNKATGHWEDSLLAQLDKDLLQEVGWESDELDKLLQLGPDEKDDMIPDVKEEPISKRGEVYELGRHRLMCGDATSKEDVEKLMDGKKADMVFTDPPYNIAEKTTGMASNAPTNKQNKKLMDCEWDKGFVFENSVPALELVCGEDCTVYICCSSYTAPSIWKWMDSFLEFSSYCIWSKPNPFPSLSKRRWVQSTEIVCYGTRGRYTFNYPLTGNALSVWTLPIGEGGLHPTQKPVSVPSHAIEHSSKEGHLVVDLFGGSGSTLIAAEKTGRVCYGMEIDPHYCDVIRKRYNDYVCQDK